MRARIRQSGLQRIFLKIIVFLLLDAVASATELKWRAVWQVNTVETVDVGDEAGHTLGLGQATGLGFFDKDQVATIVTTFTNDLTHGSGTGKTYVVHTFEDGSVFVITFRPVVTADSGAPGASFKGTFEFVSGSGRFSGIKGNGSFSGRRFGGLESPSQVYFDFAGSFSLAANP